MNAVNVLRHIVDRLFVTVCNVLTNSLGKSNHCERQKIMKEGLRSWLLKFFDSDLVQLLFIEGNVFVLCCFAE